MKKILFIIVITTNLLPAAEDDSFYLSLEFYSRPFRTREWSVTIERKKDGATIDIKNFRGKNLKRKIDTGTYISLLNQLNKRSIWRLKDIYPGNSLNGYYSVTIRKGPYSNHFKVEYGTPLTGKRSRYREIIRLIINRTRLELMD